MSDNREAYKAVQKAVASIILSPDFRATDWESRSMEDVAMAAIAAWNTRPAENVEAEPVADLPADVRRLVIAARIVAFEDRGPEALHELDLASEAFADRVPWENEDEG